MLSTLTNDTLHHFRLWKASKPCTKTIPLASYEATNNVTCSHSDPLRQGGRRRLVAQWRFHSSAKVGHHERIAISVDRSFIKFTVYQNDAFANVKHEKTITERECERIEQCIKMWCDNKSGQRKSLVFTILYIYTYVHIYDWKLTWEEQEEEKNV